MKFIYFSLLLSAAAGQTLRTSTTTFTKSEPIKEDEPILISDDGKGGSSGGCTCRSDYDCNRPICVIDPYSQQGTCQAGGGGGFTSRPTPAPVQSPTGGVCPCDDPHHIPTECEVVILIELLDIAISSDHKLAAQWLRLAFHDAGTFNTALNEGGANGCLMTHFPMRNEPENGFLDIPINTLEVIKSNWEAHVATCVAVSAADIMQFAGHMAAVRQSGVPGMTSSKVNQLMSFEWGRSDEPNCDTSWTDNLPGFSLGSPPSNIPLRCAGAGIEIKEKMMERNGFTAQEATALIGAHTIGLTRNSFGPGLAGPWVANGADNATPDGPVFDNGFHDFLENTIMASDTSQFASNQAPFNQIFGDWFRDSANDINHLDTDVVLAFPSTNTADYPHYHTFTAAFAADNNLFLTVFFAALKKMSALGVDDLLSIPTECPPDCDTIPELEAIQVISLVKELGNATAEGDAALDLKQDTLLKEQRLIDTVEISKEDLLSANEAEKMLNDERESH